MAQKNKTPVELAIEAVGGQAKLAKALGKPSQFIYRMKKKGGGKIATKSIPPEVWAKVTGLPKSVLFPDFQD